ncbi:hypothetical protein [Lachnoclostridium sp. Marseille-P6806]|uniref:hypothetical protein n=1 Tax=Lachnoclostridium sp. Marseille-P6806 TaxID=2364793 RepID=UPI0010304145|nr:hypothetical protein [Lachnoclostridium sp. Marseille-P6806]
MAEHKKLVWDAVGEKRYETGTDRGVLYPQVSGAYPKGVAWSGLISVTLSPSGGDENAFYADNIKYGSIRGAEDFGGTITSYYYPDEFAACDGSTSVATGVTISQQKRTPFGMCYRSLIGNDADGIGHGYTLHLIYNATVSPSEREYQTVNDSPEGIEFSHEFSTTPVGVTKVEGAKPTALLEIDSTVVDAEKLKQLETILYGSDSADARLPLPDEVIQLFKG